MNQPILAKFSDDNIPAWCKEDEGTYGNIPPPPPEILLGGGGAGYAERSGSESPPPPPLPSSMPPRLSGINLKEKFDAIGLSGRNGPNSSGRARDEQLRRVCNIAAIHLVLVLYL